MNALEFKTPTNDPITFRLREEVIDAFQQVENQKWRVFVSLQMSNFICFEPTRYGRFYITESLGEKMNALLESGDTTTLCSDSWTPAELQFVYHVSHWMCQQLAEEK